MHTKNFKIKHSDLLLYKKKRLARYAVKKALRLNQLKKPECCALCKYKSYLSAHHTDYGKPLLVVWLCDSCHGKVHRKDHPLNPMNNKQTPISLDLHKKDTVTVAFSMPVKTFLALKTTAQERNVSISKLLRTNVEKDFPIDDSQLTFNFEEYNEERSESIMQRVSNLAENAPEVQRQELPIIQEVWSEGDNGLSRMGKLRSIPQGYGTDAPRLQLTPTY